MPIRIIEAGRNPDTIPYRGRCSSCRTLVEAPKYDCKEVEPGEGAVRERPWLFVACPVCYSRITMNPYTPGRVTIDGITEQ